VAKTDLNLELQVHMTASRNFPKCDIPSPGGLPFRISECGPHLLQKSCPLWCPSHQKRAVPSTHLSTIQQRHTQTDRQTDRHTIQRISRTVITKGQT